MFVENTPVYIDATKKKFRIILKINNNKVNIKIKEVIVLETIDLDYYRKKVNSDILILDN
ncbi:MAG: hypothetical protein GY795_23245 [Desulfobacterales bacterium]|nr:hypothetical protein [Desulfobacterales bacterium]